jgi:hypothetical protein
MFQPWIAWARSASEVNARAQSSSSVTAVGQLDGDESRQTPSCFPPQPFDLSDQIRLKSARAAVRR